MQQGFYQQAHPAQQTYFKEAFHQFIRISFGDNYQDLGWISPKSLPEHGLAYLVSRPTDSNMRNYKIFAYLDKSGRLFDCQHELKEPPAHIPLLKLEQHPLYDQEGLILVPQKQLAELKLYEQKNDHDLMEDVAEAAFYFSESFPFELQRHEQKFFCLAQYQMLKKTKKIERQEFRFKSSLLDNFIHQQHGLQAQDSYKLPELMLLAYLTVLPDLQSLILSHASSQHELKEGRFFELTRSLNKRQSFKQAQKALNDYLQDIEKQLEDPHEQPQAHEIFFMQLIKEYGLTTQLGAQSQNSELEMHEINMAAIFQQLAEMSGRAANGEGPDIHIAFIDGNSLKSSDQFDSFMEMLDQAEMDEGSDFHERLRQLIKHTGHKAQSSLDSIALTNSPNNQLYLTVLNQHAYQNHELLFWADKLECAFNRTILALVDAQDPCSLESLSIADWHRFTHVSELAPPFSKKASLKAMKYESWEARTQFIRAMRKHTLPHRVEFQLRFDISMRKALLHLWGPPLSCVGTKRYLARHKIWWNNSESERNIFQTHYIAQLAALAAATLFAHSPHTQELCIQLNSLEEDLGQVSIGALYFTRDNFSADDIKKLNTEMNHVDFFEKFGISTILTDNILTTIDESYELSEPPFDNYMHYYLDLHLPQDQSEENYDPFSCPIPEAYQEELHATILEDLAVGDSIYLNCSLQQLNFEDFAFANTQELVAKILEEKKRTDDPFTHIVYDELIQGLVAGTLSFESSEELLNFIFAGGRLGEAVQDAEIALDNHQPQEALEILYPLLEKLENYGLYQDDEYCIWRIFGHHSERILYSYEHQDDDRKVRLASWHIIRAYNLAANAFIMLDKFDDARSCVTRAQVIAPYSEILHETLSKLNLIQDKTLAIQEHSRFIFKHSLNPVLLTMGYAQLAIILSKEGRIQEAISCSSLAQEHGKNSPLIPDHLKNNPHLAKHRALIPPQEAQEILSDLGFVATPNQELLRVVEKAARAACSCGLFPVAADLMHILGQLTDRELYTDVWESLSSNLSHLGL